MINFITAHHFGYQDVENYILVLRAVDPETKLVEISIQVELTYPRACSPYPRFYLVDHGMQGLEIGAFVAFQLCDVIDLGNWLVPFPFVGSDLGAPVDMLDEHILQGTCGKVLDVQGVHTLYLAMVGKFDGGHCFLFLCPITAPYLALLITAKYEFVDLDKAVHRMVPTGCHRLPHFEHEQACRLFSDAITHLHLRRRKALGGGGHFKADEKSGAYTEPYPVEDRVRRWAFSVATAIAGP